MVKDRIKNILRGLSYKYVSFDKLPYTTVDIMGDGQEMPFKNETFHVILTIQSLEHILNSKKISEIYRVLKKNGFVFCSVPFTFPVHGAPDDYWRFTEYALRHLFYDFNVKIEKTQNVFYTLSKLVNVSIHNAVPFRINILQRLLYPFKRLLFIFNNIIGLMLNALPKEKRDFTFPFHYYLVDKK